LNKEVRFKLLVWCRYKGEKVMEVFKFNRPTVDFMSRAKHFAILSSTLILISLGLLLFKGLNYGIDFAWWNCNSDKV